MYTPDAWVILKLTSQEYGTHYRVLAGWYGGFLGSNSWKINSGITRIVEDNDILEFHGESGSIYYCARAIERMSNLMQDVLLDIQANHKDTVEIEVIDFDKFILEFKP